MPPYRRRRCEKSCASAASSPWAARRRNSRNGRPSRRRSGGRCCRPPAPRRNSRLGFVVEAQQGNQERGKSRRSGRDDDERSKPAVEYMLVKESADVVG